MNTETVHHPHHHQHNNAISGDFSDPAVLLYKGRKYWPPVLLSPRTDINNNNNTTNTNINDNTNNKDFPAVVEFDTCVLDHFSQASDRMYASVTLNKNGLLLSPASTNNDNNSTDNNNNTTDNNNNTTDHNNNGKSTIVPVEHSPYCPIRFLASHPDIHKGLIRPLPPVKVGVAVLIENRDKVLITRRSPTMRTFPSVWVVPGGHMEVGEGLEQTAIREVFEETGIFLSKSDVQIFLIYESVFPVLLTTGPPSDHHIVIYMKATVNINEDEINLQPSEIDAAAWLSKETVEKALSPVKRGPIHDDNAHLFEAFEVKGAANKELVKYNVAQLQSYLESGLSEIALERLSTGTRFVLREWLLSVQNSENNNNNNANKKSML